jgi:hypothetical protein
VIIVLAAKSINEKEKVMATLKEMGLDQIAKWIHILPEDRWENMFVANWPILAKKCGVQEDLRLHIF